MIPLICIFLVAKLCLPCIALADVEWKEIKGDHFIIYFVENKKFAKEVLRHAEKYYKKIASELGYARYSDFWKWDKRVKIYIYKDRTSFFKEIRPPEWSEGLADYKNKTIISYAWSKGFLEALLPHEMTHLIFRDYVGFKGEIPIWLDEGVAQWQEPAKRAIVKSAMLDLFDKGKVIPLSRLMELDIRKEEDKELVRTYYIEAVSLVGFLIEEYGSKRFIAFCRQLRDGKSMDEALRFSYPTSIRSLDELEEEWRGYIRKEKK